jgi:hypothetical protein
MTFELEAEGVRVRCSSPVWARKLVEKGARLIDPTQAVYLRAEELSTPPPKRRPRKDRATSESGD